MGTSEFAVPALKALIRYKFEIIGIVTQPDRPSGRGKRLHPPPVKVVAVEHQLPIYQPEKVREPNFVHTLERLAPDVTVVAAFGQLLPQTVLDIPPCGHHQSAPVPATEIQRCCTYSVGTDQRRNRNRRDTYATGCR